MGTGLKNVRGLLALVLALAAGSAWATPATSYFIYDESGHIIGEYDTNGNPVQEHVYLGDRPVAVVQGGSSGTVDYVSTDQLNTPRVVTDGSKAVLWSWNSDPFGNASPTGSLTYNVRFPGQYYDAETGKNYNYERDYDPSIGRYVESDLIGLGGGTNTYAYVRNNPEILYDSRGMDSSNVTHHATPVCQNNQLVPSVPNNYSPCIRGCTYLHENVHIIDAYLKDIDVCDGQPNGTQILLPEYDAWIDEVKAYTVSIRCLEAKLNNNPCDKCRKEIRDHLDQEKQELATDQALIAAWNRAHPGG